MVGYWQLGIHGKSLSIGEASLLTVHVICAYDLFSYSQSPADADDTG